MAHLTLWECILLFLIEERNMAKSEFEAWIHHHEGGCDLPQENNEASLLIKGVESVEKHRYSEKYMYCCECAAGEVEYLVETP